jgi:hypothetical protein
MKNAMELTASDYTRLLREANLDVFSELVKLNQLPYYHKSLDVIKWARRINLDRIKAFMK